jgi:hypothetical protein
MGTGYGAVLDDSPATPLLNGAAVGSAAYENVTSFGGKPLRGAFTIWVRRDVVSKNDGQLQDFSTSLDTVAGDTTLVLTSEGVAPDLLAGAFPDRGLRRDDVRYQVLPARAVRVLQVKLTYAQPGNPCDSAEGQAGTTASGANFGACSPLTGVGPALGSGGGGGGDTGAK